MMTTQTGKGRSRLPKSAFLAFVLALLVLSGLLPARAEVRQIDPFGTGARFIPDIQTGGIVFLNTDEIIDVVILGDGYLSGEDVDFFNDAADWYDLIFDPTNGIRPFTSFRRAFRVHAVFKQSTNRASGPADADRQSYFKVKLECSSNCGVYIDSSWWDDNDTVNRTFRERVFKAIDEVSPLNLTQYPSNLEMSDQADLHSNLVAVMLIRRSTDGNQPGGVTGNIPHTVGTRIVRIAMGVNWEHEFSHAFPFLKDEYIHTRGSTVSGSNPAPSDRSVFNVINLTYTNDRCDLLWPHLAPGGLYNPDKESLIGNLWKGGRGNENGVWHSEYSCLINGTHDNYFCNVEDGGPATNLRDHNHFCFWCEEIVAMRILEKTHQLERPGDPADINDRGRAWFQRWESSLRNLYYNHFNVRILIAEKNACYETFYGTPCPSEFPDCMNACDRDNVPSCIAQCTIREIGNAMYVADTAGIKLDGSRKNPYDDIFDAINGSYKVCTDPHLIVMKPGSYPDAITLGTPSTIMAEGCTLVAIGR